MVGLHVVVAVSPAPLAGRTQVRRVAVNQFRAPQRETGQERVGAAGHKLHRVTALKPVNRALVPVNPNAPLLQGLALHQQPAPKMRLHIQIVRGGVLEASGTARSRP